MSAYLKCLIVSIMIGTCVSVYGQVGLRPMNIHEETLTTAKGGVHLFVTVPKKCIAGNPLALRCIVENKSKKPVSYFDSGRDDIFHIDLADSDEKKVPATRFGQLNLPSKLSLRVSQEIPAGKKLEVNVPLSRLFDLTIADSYKLTIRCRFNEEDEDNLIDLVIKETKLVINEPK